MPLRRLAFLLISLVAVSTAPAALPEQRLPGRLPTDVVPLHYDISVDPDAEHLAFSGSETVTISVLRSTTTIVMNAAELAVGNVRLDNSVAPSRVTLDEASQTLTLRFARPVSAGRHSLAMTYSGKINQSAAGLFAVDYKDGSRDRRMLVTQFEAADARRFAPMWDEPARKATFQLTVATPKGLASFSNMPVAATRPGTAGKTWTTFAVTPRMSSYLLFLGQGDVERRTTRVGKTEIGVITRRGAGDQGQYALDISARLLAYYNDYFGTPYPLPKLDMIAAPGSSQFFAAMENWGAILYFDRELLIDPRVTTESQRQDIFNNVAHEMAHQWFGNLVTMRWWDDLWLNEGFASWMASKASNDLNPEWHVAAQTTAFARQNGMGLDARSSTHPIIRPIATVDEVSASFDTIIYQKGEAVIRMLEGAVGADAFRSGVRAYFARHAYGNTVTDDLWSAVSAAARRPIKPFMDSFTLQAGVPLITVGEPACVGGRTRLSFTQGRFGVDAPSKVPQKWIVPVAFAGTGPGSGTVDVAGGPVSASVPGCAGPVIVNPGQLGYYRTLYAPRHFAALAQNIGTLPLSDQVGTIADTLALANGEYTPLDRYFLLVDSLSADTDPLTWTLVAGQLRTIAGVIRGSAGEAAFAAKVRVRLAPQFARLGFEEKRRESAADRKLREALIEVLGMLGDPQVAEGVRRYVAGGVDPIPAAVREPVLGIYAYNATPEEWERLHALARAERNPVAQRLYWTVLGEVRDPALAERALAIALTEEASVPDRANIIRGVAAVHPALAFDWAVAHAAQVNALLEASSRTGFIPRLASESSDPAVAERVAAYAQRALPVQSRQGADFAVVRIRYLAKLRAIQAAPAARWAAAP